MPIIPIYTYVRQYQISSDVKGWYPNIIDTHHPKYIYLEREKIEMLGGLEREKIEMLVDY